MRVPLKKREQEITLPEKTHIETPIAVETVLPTTMLAPLPTFEAGCLQSHLNDCDLHPDVFLGSLESKSINGPQHGYV